MKKTEPKLWNREPYRTVRNWIVAALVICVLTQNTFVIISGAEMTELSEKLNYDREVIRVWFCNKRQALKNTIKKLKGPDGSQVSWYNAGLGMPAPTTVVGMLETQPTTSSSCSPAQSPSSLEPALEHQPTAIHHHMNNNDQ